MGHFAHELVHRCLDVAPEFLSFFGKSIYHLLTFECKEILMGEIQPPGLENLKRYVAQFPERLIGFPRIDPKFGKKSVEIFETTIKANPLMKGLKLHPISNLVKPFAPLCVKLIRKAGELGVPVFIHCGDKIPELPLQIARAAGLCPDTTIICHMGGYFHTENILRFARKYPNLVLDTSTTPYPMVVRQAIELLGPERVVFATYSPAGDPVSELQKIRMMNLQPDVEERMLWENIAELLDLEVGRN